ncbi:MAG: hypothetical protein HY774_04670 [Acidobacteria bacterium]|nr:hypothetical protein [Acidobacteriota bacterium]
MAFKVVKKSTGEIGYGDLYPSPVETDPFKMLIKFPTNQKDIVILSDDPEYKWTYLDECDMGYELVALNDRLALLEIQLAALAAPDGTDEPPANTGEPDTPLDWKVG